MSEAECSTDNDFFTFSYHLWLITIQSGNKYSRLTVMSCECSQKHACQDKLVSFLLAQVLMCHKRLALFAL